MILPWNRREVYMGNSLTEFSKAQQALAVGGIGYTHRVVDGYRGSRGRTGSMGVNQELMVTYYLYVHPKDYERACAAIAGPA